MKRIIFALLFLPQLTFAQYKASCFSLEAAADIKQVAVKQTIDKDAEIPFGARAPIYGLSVSGKVVFEDEDESYVRVIMQDDYNYDHLVYENYPLLADNMSVDFQNIAMETRQLEGIIPKSIRVELKNATLKLEALNYVSSSATEKGTYKNEMELHKEQSQYIVDRLNENLIRHDKTWRAGMTSVAEKTYEEKKAMFGGVLPQLYGFEYYAGGIFVMPGAIKSTERAGTRSMTTSYVSEWDWRNRHGKNWMTSVKDQGQCGSCWAHAAIATLEAYVNLYYNMALDYNLSEQELVSCMDKNGCNGGDLMNTFEFLKSNGVVDEDCFGYSASYISCNQKCQNPSERITVLKFGSPTANVDSIKRHLFKAPIAYALGAWGHAMVMAGYKTIVSGDVIYLGNGNSVTISSSNHADLIGQTAWLFKNSWGSSWGNQGYCYVIADNHNYNVRKCLDGKISSLIYTDSDIVIEDADGDGYYYWGPIGKPSHCPSWVPDTPDGNDSDINYGPIDAYGNLQPLPTGTTIKTSITYNSNNSITQHLGVVNGGTITVKATTTMSGNGKIRVCEGGKLIVDGGTLQNADLELVPGCQVVVKNNGKVNMASGKTFDAPEGAVVEIPYGSIN